MNVLPDLKPRIQAHLRRLSCALGYGAVELGISGACVLEEGDSVAIYCGAGSVLTQASGALAPTELESIAGFFRQRECSWEAIVTPYGNEKALDALIGLGAFFMGWEQVLYRTTSNPPDFLPESSIDIVEAGPELFDAWADIGARAFHGESLTPEQRLPNEIMARLPNSRFYLARVEGESVAAGSSTVFEGIVFLGGMATLPGYRNRGIQSAMIARRLRDVKAVADLAILGAEPGGVSQRNAERAGFGTAYSALSLRVPFLR